MADKPEEYVLPERGQQGFEDTEIKENNLKETSLAEDPLNETAYEDTDRPFTPYEVPEPRDTLGDLRRGHNEMTEQLTSDESKRELLQTYFGKVINKRDNNSKELLNNLKLTVGASGKINGAEYNGKKIIIIRGDRKFMSTNRDYALTIQNFNSRLEAASKEHETTLSHVIEEQTGVVSDELNESVRANSVERLESFIDEEHEKIVEQVKKISIASQTEPKVPQREIHGVIDGAIFTQNISDDERLESLELDKKHWKQLATEEQDEDRRQLYTNLADVEDQQQDLIRLRNDMKPESEAVQSIVEEEAQNNPLTRFEKFKQWSKENMVGLSAVAISIAGILTTVLTVGRAVIQKGASALGKFGRAIANIARKLGPVISALGTLVGNILSLGAKGLLFLANNLWILVIALTYFLYDYYKRRRR